MDTEGSFLRRSFELNLIWRFEASHTRRLTLEPKAKLTFCFLISNPFIKYRLHRISTEGMKINITWGHGRNS